ncbi:MAG: hypothetical protein LBN92_06720 [Treponema sp.]|jgi:hypothetical protein|nr:hypothetical protein [Treponema sp.]
MKKFFVFIIILAAGGTAFFLGWVQFGLPAGSYGVMRSKTHGISPDPVQEGNFSWVWYKLIPCNVSVAAFTLDTRTTAVEAEGALPSGASYASLAGLRTDFSWKFSASLSWRLKPAALPALAARSDLLTQEDLDKRLDALSDEIAGYVRSLLWTYGENEKALLEARKTGAIRDLTQKTIEAFPDVEIENCSVNTISFPDFVLYGEVRAFYREFLASQRNTLRSEIETGGARNVNNRMRLDELSGYGELLTKYPILLQYLALERGIAPRE